MCDSCNHAAQNPLHGGFLASCNQCKARQIAHRPEHWESNKARQMLPAYRALLQSTFGESWQQWHETVKDWAKRIRSAKV